MSEFEPQQADDSRSVDGTAAQPDAALPQEDPGLETADSPVAAGSRLADPAVADPAVADPAVPDPAVPDPLDADSPVQAALAELDALGEQPVAEHPAVYQRVHSQLQSALSDIDDA